MIFRSKHGNESNFYWTDFDGLGAVGKLATSAFKRRQARQNSTNISSIRGHVLISFFHIFVKCVKNPFFLSAEAAMMDTYNKRQSKGCKKHSLVQGKQYCYVFDENSTS